MELASDEVWRPWAVLQHLQAVKNSSALRKVCSELQQELTQAISSIAQDKVRARRSRLGAPPLDARRPVRPSSKRTAAF